ncbi:SGNH/GDSL hydrolase family protein [Neobacillus sp. MM2021_6]|uniref:SGNH/GDSL hydrolase family protein n=1 Tax=Bacillaceae TaxID=186817 RepID=UPI00140D29BC|nr:MULTISPECIES: SGNH/GDSL hydrolase family protein [Bacillaceae]MBO0961029.1 SGNH/GDSL hydrolase family protein [Neobacillus sp. MM2021_6]NHC19059.1 SGNH/GDSL hydrolase family protein [Bacillus sp. MM2020_4]
MKNFFTILLGLACAAVLIFGHSYWNKRIEAAPKKTSSSLDNQQMTSAQTSENDKVTGDLAAYTSNWPATAIDRFKQTQKEKKPFKVLFVGSPAIGSEKAGMYPKVKENLLETFGDKNVQVNLKTYNSTTTQLVTQNKQKEIAADKADLIILEPFILENNGVVLIDTTLNDIAKIIDEVQVKNPNTTFILQPSYPLYQAKIYPNQVAELQKWAEQNKIAYLDHWTAWPDSNTSAIKEFLNPDQSAPSDKGNQVWSDYILQYLISK